MAGHVGDQQPAGDNGVLMEPEGLAHAAAKTVSVMGPAGLLGGGDADARGHGRIGGRQAQGKDGEQASLYLAALRVDFQELGSFEDAQFLPECIPGLRRLVGWGGRAFDAQLGGACAGANARGGT